MKTKLLAVIGIVVLALVAGGVWLFSQRDTLIADGIRSFLPQVLGVPVKLESVKTDVDTQTASLFGLVIGNPPDFKTPHAIAAEEIRVQLDLASLTTDVIRVHEISIVGPDIHYEQRKGGSNFDVIQRNAEQFTGVDKNATETEKTEGGKKLIIDHFWLKDGKVSVSSPLLAGKSVPAELADIHLTDIGKKSNGATPKEAAVQIFGSLSSGVAATGKSVIEGLGSGAKAVGDKIKGLFR